MKIQTSIEKQWASGEWQVTGDKTGNRRPLASCHVSRFMGHRSAFTLVELLLVLVILATLAAIVLPRFGGVSERARLTAAQTQISTFKTALNAYEVDMGSYPKSLQDLIVRPQNAGQDWHGPYLESDTIPQDPWHNNYIYTFPGRHNPSSFDLMSMGPDGQAGTADDICNWTTGSNAN